MTDPALPTSELTTFAYDPYDREKTVTRPATPSHGATTTTYVYDEKGRVIIIDAPGPGPSGITRTAYGYDSLDRLGNVNVVGAGTTYFDYDLRDNLVKTTDPRGNVTEHFYNLVDRRTSTEYPDPGYGQSVLDVGYQYNDAGELTREWPIPNGVVELARATHYKYDNLGRVIEVTGPDPDDTGPEVPLVTKFHYDANNNRTNLEQIVSPTETIVFDYHYDNLDRLWNEEGPTVDGTRTETTYAFDLAGQLIESRQKIGSPSSGYHDRVTNTAYDDLGRVYKTIGPAPNPGEPRPTSYNYYNASGDLRFTLDPSGRKVERQYDNLHRVIQVDTSN